MEEAAAQVDSLVIWNDGLGDEWREVLPEALRGISQVGYEPDGMPPIVLRYISSLVGIDRLLAVTPLIAEIRMIKSPEELSLARHAGKVANAMMSAGRDAIADQVREYEVALAISVAGTR